MTAEERLIHIEKAVDDLSEINTQQVTAIRHLMTLSTVILDVQKNLISQLKELQDVQKHTDERLDALIVTVERFIQGGRT